MAKEAKRPVATRIDPEVRRQLRIKAALEDKTMSQKIKELIEREVCGCEQVQEIA